MRGFPAKFSLSIITCGKRSINRTYILFDDYLNQELTMFHFLMFIQLLMFSTTTPIVTANEVVGFLGEQISFSCGDGRRSTWFVISNESSNLTAITDSPYSDRINITKDGKLTVFINNISDDGTTFSCRDTRTGNQLNYTLRVYSQPEQPSLEWIVHGGRSILKCFSNSPGQANLTVINWFSESICAISQWGHINETKEWSDDDNRMSELNLTLEEWQRTKTIYCSVTLDVEGGSTVQSDELKVPESSDCPTESMPQNQNGVNVIYGVVAGIVVVILIIIIAVVFVVYFFKSRRNEESVREMETQQTGDVINGGPLSRRQLPPKKKIKDKKKKLNKPALAAPMEVYAEVDRTKKRPIYAMILKPPKPNPKPRKTDSKGAEKSEKTVKDENYEEVKKGPNQAGNTRDFDNAYERVEFSPVPPPRPPPGK